MMHYKNICKECSKVISQCCCPLEEQYIIQSELCDACYEKEQMGLKKEGR